MCTATSNISPQDVQNESCIEGQAIEESHHGIAVLGMEMSESVSAAAAGRETLILNGDEEEEPTIAEPQQESSQQETQPGSSKPSESVMPRNVPPIGVAIVAGVFMCCSYTCSSTLFVMRCIHISVHVL